MTEENKKNEDVVVVVEDEGQFLPLLSAGYNLAAANKVHIHVLVVNETADAPDWMDRPENYDPEIVTLQLIDAAQPIRPILAYLREHPASVVALCLPDHSDASGTIISERLDRLLSHIKVPLALLRVPMGHEFQTRDRSVMVPFKNNEDSRYALDTAMVLGGDARLTIVSVVPEPVDDADRAAQDREFEENVAKWTSSDRVSTRLLRGSDTEQLLIDESANHDSVLIAASRGNTFLRAVIGDKIATVWRSPVQRFLSDLDIPIILFRQYQGWFGVMMSRLFSTGDKLLPTLSGEEQVDIYRQIRRAARPSQDFFLMIGFSAAIAAMGLIMESPAIIIGAMLIAPLMSAIVGIGLAIIQGDVRFLGHSIAATLRGCALAVLVGFLIGVLDFDRDVTNEMLSRSAPTLLDLIVAMVSGVAAAYALCRKDVSAALPGVAIAVALVPPLATVGLFMGMAMPALAYGALLLFLTNLAAIVFASALLFALLGFRPPYAREQDEKRLQIFVRSAFGAGLLLLLISTHLTFLSIEKATESGIERTVEKVLDKFVKEEDELFLVEWGLDDDDRDNLVVAVDFASPEPLKRARISRLANQLATALDAGVELTVLKTPAVQVSVTKMPE